MENEKTYYIGVVRSVIIEDNLTKEYGVIEADIPGIIEGIRAFPKRGELDEPKPGDSILLTNLDPVLNSYWIYEKLKENDFIGFRSVGKMVDITPDYIMVGIFNKDTEYTEDNRPTLTSFVKLDSDGNMEIKTEGKVNLNITGNANVRCSGEMKVEAETRCEINSPNVKITGGNLQVSGTTIPTVPPMSLGPFCAITTCPASGLMHVGSLVEGT